MDKNPITDISLFSKNIHLLSFQINTKMSIVFYQHLLSTFALSEHVFRVFSENGRPSNIRYRLEYSMTRYKHYTHKQVQVGVGSEDASVVATLVVGVGAAAQQVSVEFFRVTEDLGRYDRCMAAQRLWIINYKWLGKRVAMAAATGPLVSVIGSSVNIEK